MTALRRLGTLVHVAALLCLACAGPAAHAQQAAPGPCRQGNNATFTALDRIYVRDEFRIVYAVDGAHALADQRDLNANGIPDKVEDVATQLVAGRRLFSEVMGLAAPLRQPRYAQATSIDVFMLKMAKGNGLAYDEVMNYRLGVDSAAGRCALRIDLLNSRPNQNPTPVHELFHLYQYGYTMFKPAGSWRARRAGPSTRCARAAARRVCCRNPPAPCRRSCSARPTRQARCGTGWPSSWTRPDACACPPSWKAWPMSTAPA
jgi:hypothetical protein